MNETILHEHEEHLPEQSGIMSAIKGRTVQMRPRRYFVVRALLWAFAAIILFFLLLYLVSFIIFALHRDGLWFAPGLGASGWILLLSALPWGLLIASCVLLLVLSWLLRRYAFVYRRPLSHMVFISLLVVLGGGFVVAITAFQHDLSRFAERDIPVLGGFYQAETAYPAAIHRGTIVVLNNNGAFMIVDGFGVTSTIMPASGTTLLQEFHVGDIVLVFGRRSPSGVISAFGVERIGESTSTR
jgi:hypothetical protein